MSKNILGVIKYSVLLTIAAGLLFFAFKGISIKHVFSEILKAKIGWLLISVFFSLIALVSRGYRWKLLIEPLGYHPGLRNTTYSLMVGYLANLAFPRLGEVTRCGSLSNAEEIPFNKLLGTVVVERMIDVLSLFACVILVSVIEFKRLGSFLEENLALPLVAKMKLITSSSIGIIIFLLILVAVAALILFLVVDMKRKSESKWTALICGFVKGLLSIRELRKPWLFVFHSVFIWLLYYLSVYVCLFALPFTSHLGMAAALFLLVAGGLGMSAPVQGGIGAYHLLVSQGLLLYGIVLEQGLSFATLLHSLQMLTTILTGSIALLLLFLQKKRRAELSTESGACVKKAINGEY